MEAKENWRFILYFPSTGNVQPVEITGMMIKHSEFVGSVGSIQARTELATPDPPNTKLCTQWQQHHPCPHHTQDKGIALHRAIHCFIFIRKNHTPSQADFTASPLTPQSMGTRMSEGLPCADLCSWPSQQHKLTAFLGLDETDNSSIANWKYQLIVLQCYESSSWLCVAPIKSLILPSPEATDLCLREPSWAINQCNCSLSWAPTAPSDITAPEELTLPVGKRSLGTDSFKYFRLTLITIFTMLKLKF